MIVATKATGCAAVASVALASAACGGAPFTLTYAGDASTLDAAPTPAPSSGDPASSPAPASDAGGLEPDAYGLPVSSEAAAPDVAPAHPMPAPSATATSNPPLCPAVCSADSDCDRCAAPAGSVVCCASNLCTVMAACPTPGAQCPHCDRLKQCCTLLAQAAQAACMRVVGACVESSCISELNTLVCPL